MGKLPTVVLLLGETHPVSSHILTHMGVCQALLEKGFSVFVGLEVPHNKLAEVFEFSRKVPLPSSFSDHENIYSAKAYIASEFPSYAPVTNMAEMQYLLSHPARGRSLKFDFIDMAQTREDTLDIRDAPTSSVVRSLRHTLHKHNIHNIETTSEDGVCLRNSFMFDRIRARIEQDQPDFYLCHLGLCHVAGHLEEGFDYDESIHGLSSEYEDMTVIAAPLWSKNYSPDHMPDDHGLSDENAILDLFIPDRFFGSDYEDSDSEKVFLAEALRALGLPLDLIDVDYFKATYQKELAAKADQWEGESNQHKGLRHKTSWGVPDADSASAYCTARDIKNKIVERVESNFNANGSDQGPLVLLFGETHKNPVHALVETAVIHDLVFAGRKVAVGLECPYNALSVYYRQQVCEVGPVPFVDNGNIWALKALAAYSGFKYAPVTRGMKINYLIQAQELSNKPSVILNDMALTPGCGDLDKNDPLTRAFLDDYGLKNHNEAINAASPAGIVLRNIFMRDRITELCEKERPDVFIQICGAYHMAGVKNYSDGGRAQLDFKTSLAGLLQDETYKVLCAPLWDTEFEKQNLPDDHLLSEENCLWDLNAPFLKEEKSQESIRRESHFLHHAMPYVGLDDKLADFVHYKMLYSRQLRQAIERASSAAGDQRACDQGSGHRNNLSDGPV